MKKSIKKISSFILCLALLVSFSVSSFAFSLEAEDVSVGPVKWTQNQINIAARGDYMYGLTWVCQKTVTAHSYSSYYTYYAGNTYHMPYGQGSTSYYIGYGVTPENFLKAASDVNSIFYTQKSYVSSWYSTYYIQDCSGFVSWCWGLSAKQSTRSLGNYSSYIASITTNNIRNYLQVGDAINRYDYHVVLVTDISYDANGNMEYIEITEQTIPETKRTVYTPAGLASAYSSYDGIYRYYGTVPQAPYQVSQSDTSLEGHSPINLGNDFYAYVKQASTGLYLTNSNNNVCVSAGVDNGTQKWRFVRQTNGAYSLSTDGTTYWMNVANEKYENGNNINSTVGNGSYAQKFYVYYINGYFYLKSMYDNRMIDVDTATGNVQLFGQESNITNRAFDIYKINFDYYAWAADVGNNCEVYIRNVYHNYFLTAEGNIAKFAPGTYADNQKWIVNRTEYGAYVIKSKSTGKVLNVSSAKLDSGTSINLYEYNGSKAQSFFFDRMDDSSFCIKPSYTNTVLTMNTADLCAYSIVYGAELDQKFEIISEHHISENGVLRFPEYLGESFDAYVSLDKSGFVLTGAENSVFMSEKTLADNQIWTFIYDKETNAYEIVSKNGLALDVKGVGYSNGTPLQLYERNDSYAQRFRIYATDSGYIISPVHTQKIIDVESANGITVQLYGAAYSENRLFSISIVSYNGNKPSNFGESFESSILNVNSGKYVSNSNSKDIKCENTETKWLFVQNKDGSYVIKDKSSGLVLDVKNGMVSDGTGLQLYEANGTLAQSFFIYESNGGYVLISAKSGKALDMDSNSAILHTFEKKESESALKAQTFALPNAISNSLILKAESKLKKTELYLTNVSAKTTVSALISQFENEGVEIHDKDGNKISENAFCGTGCKVVLVIDGEIVDSLKVVVSGDVDGNGSIDTTDYLRIKGVFLETYTLEGEYFLAGDVDGTGIVDSTDYLRI